MLKAKLKSAAAKRPRKRRGTRRTRQSHLEPEMLEDMVVELAVNGMLAGAAQAAVRAQKEAGLPITYKRGSEIVKEFADGRQEVLSTVPSPVYKLKKHVAKIHNG